jgi:hypothetical protein
MASNSSTSTVGNSSPSSTSTSTVGSSSASSTYVPLAATQVSHIKVPCDDSTLPDLIKGTYNTTAVFKPYCGWDNSGHDLVHLVMYSFQDCLDACVSYNNIAGGDSCVISQFNSWMGVSVRNFSANCFLKSKAYQGGSYEGTLVLRLCKDLKCGTLYD